MSTIQALANLPAQWRQNNRFRQWVVVAGVVLLSAAVAYRDSWTMALLLVGALPALVGVWSLARWPALGLVVIIPASLYVPFSIGTGTGTTLNATVTLVLVLSGLWVADMLTRQGRITIHPSRAIYALLLLVVVAILAFFVGQLPWFATRSAPLPAQLGGLAVFPISALAFLLGAHQFRELRWLKWAVWLFIILAGAFIVIRMIPRLAFTIAGWYQWGATASPFWYWLVALTAGQLFFNTKLEKHWRLLLALLLVATFFVSFWLTFDWASGWIPSAIALAAILLFRWPRLAVLGGLAAIPLLPLALEEILVVQEYSYSTRVEAWEIMFEIIRVNPIFGLGPANYYWITPLFPIRGYYVEFNSHSQYIDIIAQIGVVGMLAYLWFLWEFGRLALNLRKRVPVGFARGYVYAVLGGLAGTIAAGFLGDWILPFVYNVGYVGMRSSLLGWMFMGGLLALAYTIDWKEETAEK